ncbi:hypothetical protein EVAR_86218_1 [Eumeta japonica]|uniref:Uncharacterized protein n=1 Tax=Eumeta variegata TaxID=151549 RepID=A0A4C1UBN9_EUMVA|nr:hypothetical protein EVAR_86218_1 [Eumeta japonica]
MYTFTFLILNARPKQAGDGGGTRCARPTRTGSFLMHFPLNRTESQIEVGSKRLSRLPVEDKAYEMKGSSRGVTKARGETNLQSKCTRNCRRGKRALTCRRAYVTSSSHLGGRGAGVTSRGAAREPRAAAAPQRPCGLMDKASDFGSEDCRFESCHGQVPQHHGFALVNIDLINFVGRPRLWRRSRRRAVQAPRPRRRGVSPDHTTFAIVATTDF